eukprot:SAG31_NODE_1888_length_6987_cov_1.481852_8_plen_163_part_00
MPIVLAGLTDVWSAIRKSCASRLYSVDCNLELEHLVTIFRECVAICRRPLNESWQAKEGALLTITAILRKFRIELVRDATNGPCIDSFTPPRANRRASGAGTATLPMEDRADAVMVLFGVTYRALPTAITGSIASVLYGLLPEAQLSVRENATKAFAAFLSR